MTERASAVSPLYVRLVPDQRTAAVLERIADALETLASSARPWTADDYRRATETSTGP